MTDDHDHDHELDELAREAAAARREAARWRLDSRDPEYPEEDDECSP